jgi:hypothetical protein
MKDPMTTLHFIVTSYEEIKTLVGAWKDLMKVMAREGPKKSRRVVLLSLWHHVEITLEPKEGPGQEIVLLFLAPLRTTERFRQALLNLGLKVEWEFKVQDLEIICRLLPPESKP